MKRLLPVVLMLLVCAAPQAEAQRGGWDLNVGYSLIPQIQSNYVFPYFTYATYLEALYRPYQADIRMSGALSLEAMIPLRSCRWSLSAMLSWTHVESVHSSQVYEQNGAYTVNLSDRDLNGNALAVLCFGRYDYLRKENFRLYSGLGAGWGHYAGFERFDDRIESSSHPEIQLIPVGLTFGRKWYGLFETGIGSQWCGGRLGFGLRF